MEACLLKHYLRLEHGLERSYKILEDLIARSEYSA